MKGNSLRPRIWNCDITDSKERTKTAMESLAESMREQSAMPRFDDGAISIRKFIGSLAEDVVNTIMDVERCGPDIASFRTESVCANHRPNDSTC